MAIQTAAIAGGVGFAAAQPLYDVLARNATFFVAHQADGLDLALFCLALSVALPLAATLVVAGLRALGRWPGAVAFTAVLAACGAVLALGLVRPLAPGGAAAALAAAFGAGLAGLLARWPRGVRGAAVLGIGTLVFPVLFLARPDVRALWRSEEAAPAAASEDPAPRAANPVVVVVFDELPAASLLTPDGEIDGGRFPSFARLAATASWYREATTVSQATIYSVPAILTGSYPEARVAKSPIVKYYRSNLFTVLAKAMPVNAWETMTHLCPRRICRPAERWLIPRRERLPAMLSDAAAVLLSLVAPADWGGALPTLDDQWRDFWGAGRAPVPADAPRTIDERAKRPGELFDWFLNTIEQRGTEPALHFAHVMLPHRPWVWMPNGRRFPSYLRYPHGLVSQTWHGSEWETTQAHQRHLLTVGYVDTLVGRLLDTLERTGIFDETLLVITSDHGATFRTGRLRRNLALQATYEIVGVPLFVKYPGQRVGQSDGRNAETIDIAATIYEVLGREPFEAVDGKSLRGPAAAKGELKRTFRSGNKSSTAGGILEYATGDEEGRQEALAEIARRFGTGSWETLYAAGPRPELIGRRSSGGAAVAGGTRVEIVDLDALAAVDLEAPVLPVHLYGKVVAPPGAAPHLLALAVNGRIRATTETFAGDGGPAFTALLPPAALRSGENRLEVFAIEGEGGATTLRRLPASNRPREAA